MYLMPADMPLELLARMPPIMAESCEPGSGPMCVP